jgi:hypothetical protein
VNPLWIFGLVVPIVLAWQSASLRKQANDALVTVVAARPTLNEPVTHHVREEVVREVALKNADRHGNVVSLDMDVKDEPFRHEALVEKEDGTRVAVRLDARFNLVGLGAATGPDEPDAVAVNEREPGNAAAPASPTTNTGNTPAAATSDD